MDQLKMMIRTYAVGDKMNIQRALATAKIYLAMACLPSISKHFVSIWTKANTDTLRIQRCGSAEVRRCGDAKMRRGPMQKCGDAETRRCGGGPMQKCGHAEKAREPYLRLMCNSEEQQCPLHLQ